MPPEFLVIGGAVADKTSAGLRLGGGAVYGALAAHRLGLNTALVTIPHQRLDISAALPGIAVHLIDAPASTAVFENIETPSERIQRWCGDATRIRPDDIPVTWQDTPVVFLAPTAQEVDVALVSLFPNAVVGVSPQGWFRLRNQAGFVFSGPWRGAVSVLARADVVVVSPQDYGARRGVERLLARVPLLAITEGQRGVRLRTQKKWQRVSAFSVNVVDTTGAGDVFAAALMVALREGMQPLDAARFASCAASFVVEGEGFSALPTRDQVEHRLAAGNNIRT